MKVCPNHKRIVSCVIRWLPSPIGLYKIYVCPVCEKIFERKVIVEKFKIKLWENV